MPSRSRRKSTPEKDVKDKKPPKRKAAPKRCLFCNKEFDEDEQPESVKAGGRPRQYFHYRCYESWRDTMRRGGVMLDARMAA